MSTLAYRQSVPGLPDLTVAETVWGEHVTYKVRLKQEGPPIFCPLCGDKKQFKGRESTTSLKDLPQGDLWTTLEVDYHLWNAGTGHDCRMPHPLANIQAGHQEHAQRQRGQRQRGLQMTQRLLQEAFRRFCLGESVASLHRWCGVSETTLRDAIHEQIPQELAALRERARERIRGLQRLGIDEIVWWGEVYAVLTDLDRGTLVDFLPDRETETVARCLETLRELRQEQENGRAWRPVIVTDMWMGYREAIREVFGTDVLHVTDRFHVQKKIPEALYEEGLKLFWRNVRGQHPETPDYMRQEGNFKVLRSAYLELIRSQPGAQPPRPFDLEPTFSASEWDDEPLPEPIFAAVEDPQAFDIILELSRQLTHAWGARSAEEARRQIQDWRWAHYRYKFRRPQDAAQGRGDSLQGFERLSYLHAEWETEILRYFELRSQAGQVPDPSGKSGRVSGGPVENLVGRLRGVLTRAHARGDYDVLCLRAISAMNDQREPRQHRFVLEPDLSTLPGDASEWTVINRKPKVVWTLPLGGVPTQFECSVVEVRGNGRRQVLARTDPAAVLRHHTERLEDYVLRLRRQGDNYATLSSKTGLYHTRVVEICSRLVYPEERPQLPEVVCLLTSKWRRQRLWFLSDAASGKVLRVEKGPLLDSKESETFSPLFLKELQEGQTVLCTSLAGLKHSHRASTALDRHGAYHLIHSALKNVIRSYNMQLPRGLERTAPYRHNRRLLSTNPDNLESDQQELVAQYLGESPSLSVAYQGQRGFMALYDLPDSKEFLKGLRGWLTGIDQRDPRIQDDPQRLRKSVHYSHKNVAEQLKIHGEAIVRGYELHRRKLTIGKSAQEIGRLRKLPAWRQPDFEFLEYICLEHAHP